MEPDLSFMALCETSFINFTWANPLEVPEIMGLVGNKQ
jgi:hypothetical protein